VCASEFRANWQVIFNEIAATGESVILTKRGKPLFLLESGGYVTVSLKPHFAHVRIPNICVGRPAGWRG
jgi:hypothetical protein